jgi:hypothetical protein
LTIGLNMGLWICAEINTHLLFNLILIWAARSVSRLSCVRWKAQIHLSFSFRLWLIMNVRSLPRFTRTLQCSRLCINTRTDVLLWLSGQWRFQDSCWWRFRRLRLPLSDQTTPLASSLFGELFDDVRSTIYTVNHAVHWYQMSQCGTNRYRFSNFINSMWLIISSNNWTLN